MLNIERVENGLRLFVLHEDRLELKELYEALGETDTWAELMEPFSNNGMYYSIDPEYVFVGLTSDPYIVTDDISKDDEGDITIEGIVWYCPDYQVISVIEKLIEDGEFVLLELK